MEHYTIPVVYGGDLMSPLSLCPKADFFGEVVGNSASNSVRTITNLDESTYNIGYNSDGEIGPFLDTGVGGNQRNKKNEEDDLPEGMLSKH